MSTLSKRWVIASPTSPEILSRYPNMGSVLAQVLYNRGFTTPIDAEEFLSADAESFLDSNNRLFNPFQIKDMIRAVERISQAIKKHEQIIVYGDFDADGVTSTTLMVQVLTALGAVVKPYIPHRVDEGYGLNSEALLRFAREGVKLVITVDCGIRSVAEVEDGKDAQLDIIVTDHHTIGPEIPKALAVINPKQEDCKYPEDMLAGVGVAFKLADALLRRAKEMHKAPIKLQTEDLLDLVAIGTVADLAPMNRSENRALVRRGLEIINKANRPGIRALLDVSGVKPGTVTAMNIGFSLGPRINAAGRLESAMIAYNLLSTEDYNVALRLAEQLQKLNVERQDLTRAAQEKVRGWVEEQRSDAPLIFASGDFRAGIVGLVAGRLTEEYSRPTIIMEVGETESRASCRSIPQFDITHALDQCADLLVRHGGHAQAAGFTVANMNIPALKAKLMKLADDSLSGQDLRPILEIDVEVEARALTEKLVYELSRLEPTGYHSASPVLMTSNLRVLESRTVGKEGHHLKLKLARAGQPPLDAIGFGLGDWVDNMPERIDVAYQLEMNEWNGNRSLQLNLQDIRPAGNT